MSVTTTQNPTASAIRDYLADYELHHSGESTTDTTVNPRALPAARSESNPPDWPTNYRRVPPYRPIDRNLDREQRPNGNSAGEGVFISVMLGGVWINSTASRLWRHTGGLVNDRIFRYPIGGEW